MICAYLFVIHQHSSHVRTSRGFVVAFQFKHIIQCVVGNFKSGVNFPILMVYIPIPRDQIIIVTGVESYSKYKHCWIDLDVFIGSAFGEVTENDIQLRWKRRRGN